MDGAPDDLKIVEAACRQIVQIVVHLREVLCGLAGKLEVRVGSCGRYLLHAVVKDAPDEIPEAAYHRIVQIGVHYVVVLCRLAGKLKVHAGGLGHYLLHAVVVGAPDDHEILEAAYHQIVQIVVHLLEVLCGLAGKTEVHVGSLDRYLLHGFVDGSPGDAKILEAAYDQIVQIAVQMLCGLAGNLEVHVGGVGHYLLRGVVEGAQDDRRSVVEWLLADVAARHEGKSAATTAPRAWRSGLR